MKVPVSVIVPTLNEIENIERCLKSVSWANEIFVVDSGSVDGTQEAAEALGTKVVQFHFNGTWPKKYNWSLDNLPFSHEWVIILDADEELTPEAEEEIREICTTNKKGADGYFINRRFMFMNKWLRHAYYPNWNLRLFKRRLGRFEKLTDSATDSGDIEIHEHIVIGGKTGYIKSGMNHYAFPTIESFVEKHNRYSNWEAHVALDNYLGVKSARELKSRNVGFKRFFKVLSKKIPFRPTLRFLYVYIFQGGILDGIEGYYFARLHYYYELLCICKEYELKKQLKGGKQEV